MFRGSLLALLFCAVAARGPAQELQSARPMMPELTLSGGESGEEAIAVLGTNLTAVASHYWKLPQELAEVLRRDHSLRLDAQGYLKYVCAGLIATATETAPQGGDVNGASLFPAEQTFFLHSKPGAAKIIFLDFDGHTLSGNAWTASYNRGADIVAPPWDTNGDPTSFSASEKAAIQKIWFRVAEDYAGFDVDVTTEFPGESALTRANPGDSHFGIRALVSAIGSYFGNPGGIAYLGCFSDVGDAYKPALIFPENLSNDEKYIADAISHEIGHTVGLSHDGVVNGTEYYLGHGNWAPIMGAGFYQPIAQWSRGEYANANNKEDDYAVMLQNGLSYRSDDFGGTLETATTLSGLQVSSAGILERTNDLDFFAFTTTGGDTTFTANPGPYGGNLHLWLSLYSGSGNLLTNLEAVDTSAGTQPVAISRNLAAGNYYLSVDTIGTGDPLDTGYSDYGNVGNYTLTLYLPTAITVSTYPTNLTAVRSGDGLQLSWPASHIGWRLERRNVELDTGLLGNWISVEGATTTNRLHLPLGKQPEAVLFRLAYP